MPRKNIALNENLLREIEQLAGEEGMSPEEVVGRSIVIYQLLHRLDCLPPISPEMQEAIRQQDSLAAEFSSIADQPSTTEVIKQWRVQHDAAQGRS